MRRIKYNATPTDDYQATMWFEAGTIRVWKVISLDSEKTWYSTYEKMIPFDNFDDAYRHGTKQYQKRWGKHG